MQSAKNLIKRVKVQAKAYGRNCSIDSIKSGYLFASSYDHATYCLVERDCAKSGRNENEQETRLALAQRPAN